MAKTQAERQRAAQMRQRQIEREASASKRAAGLGHLTSRRTEGDWIRLRDEIPADTRDLTARVFGDPLPGRSALAQRAGEQR